MSSKKIRVGIIGIGFYAALTHIPELRETQQAEVVAISRRNASRLMMAQQAFGIAETFTDWREMVEKVQLDAVVVSTPHHLHTAPTLAALDKGLHVLVEKPLTLNKDEAWTLVEAAQKSGKVLMVGYTSRLKGVWQSVKQVLLAGELGQLRQINLAVSFDRRWFWESDSLPEDVQAMMQAGSRRTGLPVEFFSDWGHAWHNNPAEMGGGAFADVGTHYIDRLLWLAGAPAVDVMAMTETAQLPVDAFVNVQARLANGILLSMTSADAALGGLSSGAEYLMIVGDEGALTVDADGNICLHRDGQRRKISVNIPDRSVSDLFVNAILQGETGYPDAVEGAYAVDLIEAIYRSAAERQLINIATPPIVARK